MMCRPNWPFLHMYRSHDVRHVEFRELTGSQRTPGVWGVTLSDFRWYRDVFLSKVMTRPDQMQMHLTRRKDSCLDS